MVKLPYGYRAKFGVVVVGPNPTPREDIARMSPDGVLVLETRVSMEPRVERDVITAIATKLPLSAGILAEAGSDVIGIACTASTITGGPGYDKKEIEEMEAMTGGVPCTTVATAVKNALRWLGARRIVLASPYVDQVNHDFRAYFDGSGFQVLDIRGLGITTSSELATVPVHKVYKLGKAVCRADADAIFIPCTTFAAIDAIEDLERDTGKLVISSNQALAWEMLRIAGIGEPIHGFGSLLSREGRRQAS